MISKAMRGCTADGLNLKFDCVLLCSNNHCDRLIYVASNAISNIEVYLQLLDKVLRNFIEPMPELPISETLK